MVEDTPERIESVLGEDNLTKIQEDYTILVSLRLEVLGPSERMIMGLATRLVLHEDVLETSLRVSILVIVAISLGGTKWPLRSSFPMPGG